MILVVKNGIARMRISKIGLQCGFYHNLFQKNER